MPILKKFLDDIFVEILAASNLYSKLNQIRQQNGEIELQGNQKLQIKYAIPLLIIYYIENEI